MALPGLGSGPHSCPSLFTRALGSAAGSRAHCFSMCLEYARQPGGITLTVRANLDDAADAPAWDLSQGLTHLVFFRAVSSHWFTELTGCACSLQIPGNRVWPSVNALRFLVPSPDHHCCSYRVVHVRICGLFIRCRKPSNG